MNQNKNVKKEKVIANHDFNDSRTAAFNTVKKKYKQDSIAWIVAGLILFFFTAFSFGRITIIGQFFDDAIFNFIFGWFKYPVYVLLMIIDICIYAGIRFKFKKRFLGMVIISSALLCWFTTLVLMTNVAYNPITDLVISKGVDKSMLIDKYWQSNAIENVFSIYTSYWLQDSIFSGNFYSEVLDYFINSTGYFNLYSGGGLIGSLLTGLSMYLSLPGAYILIFLLMFINGQWILTGDAFFLFKKPKNRKGKGLRILSLKKRNNPNSNFGPERQLAIAQSSESMNVHNGWNSLNVFDKNIDVAPMIEESDFTIKLPSYNKENSEDFKTNENINFEEVAELNGAPLQLEQSIEKEDTLEHLQKIYEDDNKGFEANFESGTQFRSRRPGVSSDKLEIEQKQYENFDPLEARKMFEAEHSSLAPHGRHQEAVTPTLEEVLAVEVSEPTIASLQDNIATEKSSDTAFFDELYDEETVEPLFDKTVETPNMAISNNHPIVEETAFTTPMLEETEEEIEEAEEIIEPILESEVVVNKSYKLPSIDLLNILERDYAKERANKELGALKTLAINEVFNQFGIKAKVINTIIGPSVTKFEIQPEHGTKVNSITALENDLKLALASQNIRLEAPIQGKNLVGIEIANQSSEMVSMREIVESIPSEKDGKKLLFVLGKNVLGEPLTAELNQMPHLLVAGSTGSGKSVMINTLICSILLRAKPTEVKFLMIDPKKVELSVYTKIPHMLAPVISDMKQAASALKMIVSEMERRYDLFMDEGSRNIEGYNKRVSGRKKLPFIVVIIDELADLMMTGGKKDVEDAIMRITQMARAAGIHLIVATQRPSVDVITGTIKTNIPTRIAFAVTTGTDSRTILDSMGAEKLLGRGDMLFMPPGSSDLIRAQGAYMSDDEIDDIVSHVIKEQQVSYEDTFTKETMLGSSGGINGASSRDLDDMFEEVKAFVIDQQKASTSLIQRKFGFGYNRAANIIDDLEEKGIIGPPNGSKPREVMIKPK